MGKLLDFYLKKIFESATPISNLAPKRKLENYKKPLPSSVGHYNYEEDDEEYERQHAIRKFAGKGKTTVKKEYTTYNPSGSGYGRLLQRWGTTSKDTKSPVLPKAISQKLVRKDIKIKVKNDKKGGKKKIKK
ncbi:MAG: hypothetical protein PVG65_00855 [Candidatus Thorarchaeota archaeon]|jgi:hypothetical protein